MPQFLFRKVAALIATGALCTGAPVASADTTVVIVRHAEKPEAGLGQLKCKGLNRALALAPVLLERYGKPVAIYATNPSELKNDKGIYYSYIRPLATIEPLAIRLGMPVNISYGMTDVPNLVKELQSLSDGTVIVAWEHHWAANLAKALLTTGGGNPADVPAWNDADFDSIYVVQQTRDEQGHPHAQFTKAQQNINNLTDNCP